MYTILIFVATSLTLGLPLIALNRSPTTVGAVLLLAVMYGIPLAFAVAYIGVPMSFRRIAKDMNDPRLTSMLDEIAKKAKIKTPKLMVIDSEECNAIACSWIFGGIVILTSGLVKAHRSGVISDDEMKGILAHEIGHLKHRDPLRMAIAFSLITIVDWFAEVYLSNAKVYYAISREYRKRLYLEEAGAYGFMGAIFLLIGILLKIPAKIASLIAYHHSRMMEFDADAFASSVVDPKVFGMALVKVEKINEGLPLEKVKRLPFPDRWILKPRRTFFLDEIMSTHPPLEKRLKALGILN